MGTVFQMVHQLPEYIHLLFKFVFFFHFFLLRFHRKYLDKDQWHLLCKDVYIITIKRFRQIRL